MRPLEGLQWGSAAQSNCISRAEPGQMLGRNINTFVFTGTSDIKANKFQRE